MSAKFYPAEQVDMLLKAASESLHSMTDDVARLQSENQLLKQASTNKTTLEKVAATKQNVESFVDMLVDRAIIPDNQREKYANACLHDADAALSIAMQALKLSETPVSQGYGIKSETNYNLQANARHEEAKAWAQAID